ncbi:MAG: hypothetical protein Q9186_000726 [Xanthomendoza sp. 1 TL-2023]
MAPLTNTTTTITYPLPHLDLELTLLQNPTVTPTDKALYIAGITFILLCLLIDITGIIYLAYKLHRLFRPRYSWYSYFTNDTGGLLSAEVNAAGMREGVVCDGMGKYRDDDDTAGAEKEKMTAYRDEEDDKENIAPDIVQSPWGPVVKRTTMGESINYRNAQNIVLIKPGELVARQQKDVRFFMPSVAQWEVMTNTIEVFCGGEDGIVDHWGDGFEVGRW